MKRIAVALAVITLLAAGCTKTTDPIAGDDKVADTDGEQRMIDIYAEIVHRLVIRDHTFGTAPSPFKRVYVVDDVYHTFVDKLSESMAAARAGDDREASYGPMTMPGQLDVVEDHIAEWPEWEPPEKI